MMKSVFIFYLRNEAHALDGGFDQVISFLCRVSGGGGHVCVVRQGADRVPLAALLLAARLLAAQLA